MLLFVFHSSVTIVGTVERRSLLHPCYRYVERGRRIPCLGVHSVDLNVTCGQDSHRPDHYSLGEVSSLPERGESPDLGSGRVSPFDPGRVTLSTVVHRNGSETGPCFVTRFQAPVSGISGVSLVVTTTYLSLKTPVCDREGRDRGYAGKRVRVVL